MNDQVSTAVDAAIAAVDRQRLLDSACRLVEVPSSTGRERAVSEAYADLVADAGMAVTRQWVEDERPNAVGTVEGSSPEAPSLMLNGHLDTSYSGDEPYLLGPGHRPEPRVLDGRLYGLGIGNMKGALACYVEAVRALRDVGVTLAGDLVVAGVCGEIEKTQWGEEHGPHLRGYGCGSQHLVTHGVIPDLCVIGEPTGLDVVLNHHGALWVRIGIPGAVVHTAFAGANPDANAMAGLQDALARVEQWAKDWVVETAVDGVEGAVNVGAVRAGQPWRASRTPPLAELFIDVRVPPHLPMTQARRALRRLVDELRARHPAKAITWDCYVSVPGASLDAGSPVVGHVGWAHERVTGSPPGRRPVVWCSDASVLTRYGVAALNYGPLGGLSGPDGEWVAIDDLLTAAQVYAATAIRACGIAGEPPAPSRSAT